MALLAKIISFLAFALAMSWLAYSPGFDSGVAALASLAAFFASMFLKRKKVPPNQVQNVSGNSTGIQAGRDIGKD